MSWENFDSLKAQALLPQKNVQKEYKNLLTYKVFNTPDGKELLAFWKDFLMMMSAHPGESSSIAYFNEGKKQFVRDVLQAITESQNKED